MLVYLQKYHSTIPFLLITRDDMLQAYQLKGVKWRDLGGGELSHSQHWPSRVAWPMTPTLTSSHKPWRLIFSQAHSAIDPFWKHGKLRVMFLLLWDVFFCLVIMIFIVFNIVHHPGLLWSHVALDFGQTNKRIKLIPKYTIISQNTDSLIMPSNHNSRQITLVNLYERQKLLYRRKHLN